MLCNDIVRHSKFDEASLTMVLLQVQEVVKHDTNVFEAQIESYVKDLLESTAKLAAMKQK